MKLALVHDVAEAIVGDITPTCGVSDEEKFALEAGAVQRIKQMLGGAGTLAGEQEHRAGMEQEQKLEQKNKWGAAWAPCHICVWHLRLAGRWYCSLCWAPSPRLGAACTRLPILPWLIPPKSCLLAEPPTRPNSSPTAAEEIEELWHEYEQGQSEEARLVKDFDKASREQTPGWAGWAHLGSEAQATWGW